MNREAEWFHAVRLSGQDEQGEGFSLGGHPGLRQGTRHKSRQEKLEYVGPFSSIECERRERRYIAKALAGVPRGTSTLYWPCGRGRLLPLLKQLDCSVTCVDSSSRAVSQARFYGGLLGEDCIDDTDNFRVVDILCAGFDDDHFGAVLVNHLFCHFPEPEMRRHVFLELERICSGPIIVSFVRAAPSDKIACQEHGDFYTHRVVKQVPVNRRSLAEEVRKCGLIIDKWIPKHSLISRQTCAILARNRVKVRSSQLP